MDAALMERTRPLIVVVDRIPRSADVTAAHLRHHMRAVDVMTANFCAQARSLADRNDVTVFVVDLDLPDGKGEDLLMELLAATPNARGVLTGRSRGANISFEGLLAYLLKPFSVDELLKHVRSVILRGRDV